MKFRHYLFFASLASIPLAFVTLFLAPWQIAGMALGIGGIAFGFAALLTPDPPETQ